MHHTVWWTFISVLAASCVGNALTTLFRSSTDNPASTAPQILASSAAPVSGRPTQR
jgi:hypothetical protein